MAVTRDQARRLLSESEMTLFSDSRNPTLRSFSARELTRRIERARKLRDKSRDLLQRQRLGTRKRTGSKGGATGDANERTARKGEVLDDVLQRFESRLQDVQDADGAASGRAAAGAKAQKAKPAARKRAAKAQAAPGKATGKAAVKATSGAARTGPATAGRATTAPSGTARGASAAKKRPRKAAITPEQALAQTRELLQAKQQRDREPRAYQVLDEQTQPGLPEAGYQSGSAKSKAQELHAGEVRLEPIHGSISTRDRQSQGKRDHR